MGASAHGRGRWPIGQVDREKKEGAMWYLPCPLSRSSVRYMALQGDQGSVLFRCTKSGAIMWCLPMGPKSRVHGFESSCGILSTCPGEEEGDPGHSSQHALLPACSVPPRAPYRAQQWGCDLHISGLTLAFLLFQEVGMVSEKHPFIFYPKVTFPHHFHGTLQIVLPLDPTTRG